MTGWLKGLVTKFRWYVTSGRAQAAFAQSLDLILPAIPYLDMAAKIVAGITPTTIDDAVLKVIHEKFPKLFDKSLRTTDEVKLYRLGIATELLRSKYPTVSTSILRTAVQQAYLGESAL